MQRVMLVTGHYINSKRKAGFHWLADAYLQLGYQVTFVTVGISWLSYLKKDFRFEYPIIKEANKLVEVKPNLNSYIYYSKIHPANLRVNHLNKMSNVVFKHYGKGIKNSLLTNEIKESSLIIFESTPGLLLFKYFKEMNPNAKFVYRVSDDLRLLKVHPLVVQTEDEISKEFDLISVPSNYIYKHFQKLGNVRLNYHGVRKDLFDKEYKSPYQEGTINLVFVGNSHFDYRLLEIASESFAEYCFHIIGPIQKDVVRDNIVYYGEMPFIQTIPYIKHASIALANRTFLHGSESLTDSLKVIQYTYCNLPIIAPQFMQTKRNNTFYYDIEKPESIKIAMDKALNFDKVVDDVIYSWEELATELAMV